MKFFKERKEQRSKRKDVLLEERRMSKDFFK